ncbi:MAG TPA: tetratricopeptide repeat protein [Candidatus Krumholzibacteria bacterium]|nr:tetratricopeptide repeat protein [Candidatus Krumholzibacteria bacterium]
MKRLHGWLIVGLLGMATLAIAKSVETTSGIIYNRNGQFEEARVILLKALAKDPKDAEAHFQIGYSYSNLDSVALAYRHFVKARELDPKKSKDVANNIASNYAKHYKLGQNAFGRTDFAAAEHEFALATQADPTQSAAHYNLAVTYARLSASDSTYDVKALTEADQVLALSDASDPNYTKALQLAARLLAQMGREAEAVERFKPMIEKDPSKYPVVEETGMELLKAGNWEGAAAFLKLSADARAKVGAEDFAVYSNVGVAAFNSRKDDPAMLDEAIGYYEKALAIQPDDAPTVLNLMAAYMAKEDWENASTWGEKYVSVSPSDPKGWQYLARCYGELGDTDKASEALKRYQELKGQ